MLNKACDNAQKRDFQSQSDKIVEGVGGVPSCRIWEGEKERERVFRP